MIDFQESDCGTRIASVVKSPWWKVFEQLLDGLVELFRVLVRFLGQGLRSHSAPNQLFGVRIEQIHHQRSDLVGVVRRVGFAETNAPMAPAPASATRSQG